jgi:hypothetical protein
VIHTTRIAIRIDTSGNTHCLAGGAPVIEVSIDGGPLQRIDLNAWLTPWRRTPAIPSNCGSAPPP